MAPNISEDVKESSSEPEKGKFEIFYKGYFYDVTEFIPRHPGGNVIKFYTEHGEDATQAIEQFHYRSKGKVETILKSFKKRPAEPRERGLEGKALTRHEAMDADFQKLFEELVAEGYFKPSIPHVILRYLELIGLLLLSYGIFLSCAGNISKFITTIFMGFAFSRYGWVQHEGGHNSLTGKPKVDKFIQLMTMGLVQSASSCWWNSQHNRHHAMPQRLHHDVDLATLPYVAFHPRTVKDKSEINNFFVRYQALFYWTLDLAVVMVAWRLVLHPRYQLHKKAYFELLITLPSLIFPIYMGIFWYLSAMFWMTFFLGTNFALNHSHLEVADKPTHWIEYSLTHTANIKSSSLVDYWMGYLNFQIEHHLFPTMPQFKHSQIAHRVKALAEKHGLPYRSYSYVEACSLALKNLNDVGKELTNEGHFEHQ